MAIIGAIQATAAAAEEEEEDLFGKLPDEIIVSALSCLEKIEDRARTSLVARRWRYLWKHATSTILAFDLCYPWGDRTRVDQVIMSLSCCDDDSDNNNVTIDGFSLNVNIIDGDDLKYQRDIDGWLIFALQKKVKRINLDGGCVGFDYYSFTHSQVLFRTTIDSLTSLRLCNVGVTGEILEYILTAAPLLEELSVTRPDSSLVKFTVSGPSLKLKSLQVRSCPELELLYIHDVVNLEWLDYSGSAKCLVVKDAPRLVKVKLSSDEYFVNNDTNDVPQMMMKNYDFASVENLVLKLRKFQTIRPLMSDQFPKLRDLKRLKLVLGPYASCCRLCALLLEASPNLRELKIVIQFLNEYSSREEEEEDEDKVGELSQPHESLKVLEVIGFIGCEVDMGVVDYLIDNTTSLKKMIVDTRHFYDWMATTDPEKEQAAQELARTHLGRRLAPGVTLLVK